MNRENDPTGTGTAAARNGPLRNGNPRGNPNAAPRCGARNRAGQPCRAPAMANGRCHKHGGASTGARTPEGLAACRAAPTHHGLLGQEHRAYRRKVKALLRQARAMCRVKLPC